MDKAYFGYKQEYTCNPGNGYTTIFGRKGLTVMPRVRTCPHCHTPAYQGGARCQNCGHVFRRSNPRVAEIAVGAIAAALLAGAIWFVASAPEPDAPRETAPTPTQAAPLPAVAEHPTDIKAAIAQASPSVVRIDVRLRSGRAIGSGFIYSTGGLVLTNQHVIAGAASVTVTDSQGRQHPAQVVAQDSTVDLALLKIPELSGTPALKVTSAQHLSAGDRVVAIGSPEGLTGTVSDGIISAVHRELRIGESTLHDLLQTTAPISHGSSGGPLVEVATGGVVGITTAGSDTGSNLGFAVTSDTILSALQRWNQRP